MQAEAIERAALAEVALAPHVQEGTQIDTPEAAVAVFDEWLWKTPTPDDRPTEEQELVRLIMGR